jgi:general secretion pathway protein D
MLAGLIRDEERTSFATIPGLGDIPVLGRLFGYNRKETTETDIILTLTPRIVRVLNLTAEDLRGFRVPRDGGVTLPEMAPPLPIPLPLPKPPGPGEETVVPAAPSLAPTVPAAPGQVTPLKPPPIKPPKS